MDARTAEVQQCPSEAYAGQLAVPGRANGQENCVDRRPGEPGDSAAVPIPLVHRGRGDPLPE